MALSRTETLSDISTPAGERTKDNTKLKPLRFTRAEVNRHMFTTPSELTPDHPVRTPIGTWSYDEGIPTFDQISEDVLQSIEIPNFRERSVTIWERTKAAIIKYGKFD